MRHQGATESRPKSSDAFKLERSALDAQASESAAPMLSAPPALGGYTPSTLLSAPKHEPLELNLRAHGQSVLLKKTPGESAEHLLLKGLLWALLLPSHPAGAVRVERPLDGVRYRPDVVALDDRERVRWWGECGSVKPSKLAELAIAYPAARFSVCKFGRSDLVGYATSLKRELALPPRAAPFEVLSFPSTAAEDFLRDDGEVDVLFSDLQVIPLHDEPDEDEAGGGQRRARSRRGRRRRQD